MKESGGPVIMVLGLFSLLWLLSSPAKVEPIPVDGLIEVVATVKDSLTVEPADPQPSPSDKHEKAKREIVLFGIPGCNPCDEWKRCEQPRFEADGWVVVKSNDPMKGPWPHFIIEKNGKTYDHKGYLPFGKIDEVTR
jgi:hypothetical protein